MSGQLFIVRGRERLGPFSESAVLDLLERGELCADDLCIREGGSAAKPLEQVFERVSAAAPRRRLRPRLAGSDLPDDAPDDAFGRISEDVRGRRPARVVFRGCPSLLCYGKELFLAAAMAAGGYFAARFSGWFGFAGLVGFTSIVTAVIFHRTSRDYVVTESRIESIWGILSRSSRELRIRDIRAVNVRKRGALGLLGVGDVEFASAGSGEVEVVFSRIRAPHAIKQIVRDLQDEDDFPS